jgi:hypothetical protein
LGRQRMAFGPADVAWLLIDCPPSQKSKCSDAWVAISSATLCVQSLGDLFSFQVCPDCEVVVTVRIHRHTFYVIKAVILESL